MDITRHVHDSLKASFIGEAIFICPMFSIASIKLSEIFTGEDKEYKWVKQLKVVGSHSSFSPHL
jgi:hypothetical protein